MFLQAFDRIAGRGEFSHGDALARCKKSAMNDWSLGALRVGKVGVPGTHCESVSFSNGFPPDALNGKVQVANESAYDRELLDVFLSKDRGIWLGQEK